MQPAKAAPSPSPGSHTHGQHQLICVKNPPPFRALRRGPNPIAFLDRLAQLLEGQGRANDGARAMDGNIFNSRGKRVGRVLGLSILDLRGQRIYDLKGTNIYKLSGELVGHLPLDVRSFERRLDKSTDKLFRGG
jgi:hypothetical protein